MRRPNNCLGTQRQTMLPNPSTPTIRERDIPDDRNEHVHRSSPGPHLLPDQRLQLQASPMTTRRRWRNRRNGRFIPLPMGGEIRTYHQPLGGRPVRDVHGQPVPHEYTYPLLRGPRWVAQLRHPLIRPGSPLHRHPDSSCEHFALGDTQSEAIGAAMDDFQAEHGGEDRAPHLALTPVEELP